MRSLKLIGRLGRRALVLLTGCGGSDFAEGSVDDITERDVEGHEGLWSRCASRATSPPTASEVSIDMQT